MIFEKQIVDFYKGSMFTRCDDTETVFYFTPEDFPGLKSEIHSFKSSMGHDLVGYFYEYENSKENRLIVFDHGFGGGHRAYMKEINMLCEHGYKVFSYDHTGCMESGGESPNGLGQSLCDLNDCITMLKSLPSLKDVTISVMGHSWGAYSTLNITRLHPEITHIVAMSGFVSVPEMVNTFFSGLMKGYRKAILDLETKANPDFINYHAVDTLYKSNTKSLLIYSENDHLCKRNHYDILKSGLESKENVKFLFVKDKWHNPNYTTDAVIYLNEFSKARTKLLKNKDLTQEEKFVFKSSFDWTKMTEQDEDIWNEIFKHLDK